MWMTETRRQLPNTQNNFLIPDKTFKLVMPRNVLPLLPGCKSTRHHAVVGAFHSQMYWSISKISGWQHSQSEALFALQSDADSVCLICHNDLSKGTGGTAELQCSHSFHKEVTHTHACDVSYQMENAAGLFVCLLSASRSGCGGNNSVLPVTSRCPCHSPSSGAPLASKSPETQQRHSAVWCFKTDKVTLHSNETNTLMHLINDLMSYKRFIKVENLRCPVFRNVAVTMI